MAVIYSNRSAARAARKEKRTELRHQYHFAGDDTSIVVAKAYYVRTAEDGTKKRVHVKDLSKATRIGVRFIREDGEERLFWFSNLEFDKIWSSDTDEFLFSWGKTNELEAVDAISGEVIWERRDSAARSVKA